MSKLKAKNPDEVLPSKPMVLVFGEAGVGKTWGALDFPSTYFIDSEGGASQKHYIAKLKKAGGMYFGQEDGAQNFEDVIEQIKSLATEKHHYKTLVIDSFSHLQLLEIGKEVEKMMKKGSDMTKTYGAEKKPSASYAKRLVDWLSRLDMTTIVIAHEKQKYENSVAVGFTADAWEKMEYLFNLVLRIKKQGDSRLAFIQKSRFEGFPTGTSFSWSYDEFAARYGKDILEKEPGQITLATPEQLEEVKKLLDIVKLPEGQLDKWFLAGKVDKLEDLEAAKIDKIIIHLKARITNG